jgi:hypothetical protein
VLRLILAFVDIMLHRRGPEDLPASTFLVWTLLAASLVVELVLRYSTGGTLRIMAVSVLVTFFDLWFVWALLRTFNRERRFRQTMSAMLGVGTILNVVSAPLVPIVTATAATAVAASTQPPITLPVLLTMLIFIWQIDISAFVFARALERPYLLALAIVIAYAMLMISLYSTLAPPLQAA